MLLETAEGNQPMSILLFAAAAVLAAQATVNLTWNGSLLDDSCRTQNVSAQCGISDDTKAFGIQTEDGKYFKLDADGNTIARAALKEQKKTDGEVKASVSGSLDGSTIKVASVQVR
jgi:hypothetical protein